MIQSGAIFTCGKLLAGLLGYILVSSQLQAQPVSPLERDIASRFSIETQRKYALFADSKRSDLAYFVSREGRIAEHPLEQDRVKLSVKTVTKPEPFIGSGGLSIEGRFDTIGSASAFKRLTNEASSLGLTLAPAPIEDAEVRFIVDGIVTDASGDIEPICEYQTISLPNGRLLELPHCQAMDADGNLRPLQLFYEWNTTPPGKQGSADQPVSFTAKTFPAYSNVIADSLATGSGWDSFVTGEVTWDVDNARQTPIATLSVNWLDLYALLVDFATQRNNVISSNDTLGFAIAFIVQAQSSNAIQVDLAPGQSWGPWWNPNTDLIERIAKEVADIIKTRIMSDFIAVNPYTRQRYRLSTVNINYQAILANPRERFEIFEETERELLQSRTGLSIHCIVGGIDRKLSWDFTRESCAQAF